MQNSIMKDIHSVLKIAYEAINRQKYQLLEGLSNRLNHSITTYQRKEISDCAVAIFALSKIFDKNQYLQHPDFKNFRDKVLRILRLAGKYIKRGQLGIYYEEILSLKKEIKEFDSKVHLYEEPLLIYARGIKARHIAEHGLSIKQASKLFDIAEWDISKNLGKSTQMDIHYASALSNKKRIALAKSLFNVK